jgi:hypothetical protein
MSDRRFTTSATPHLTVEDCGGDLSITASDEPEVIVVLEDDDGEVEREGETLRIRAKKDCAITCPPASSVTLQNVGGDLTVNDLGGTLAIQNVGGDVLLRGGGVVSIQNAGADVSVRDITGELRIQAAGGDLEARRIDGRLIVGNVGGDLSARGLDGGFEIENVGGDASLQADVAPGQTHRARAGGDLTLRLPADASARFTLNAGGEIERRVEFGEWQGNAHAGQGQMGRGEAQVELSAGGDLLLLPTKSDFDFDFSLNFDALGNQLEAKMEVFERELEAKLDKLNEQIARLAAAGVSDIEARLRRIDVEGISRRAERMMERERSRVQRAAERARQQAERAAERARRRAERHQKHGQHGKHHGFTVNLGFTPSRSAGRPGAAPAREAKPPASDEERLTILRMLEQKKISADEAARLLEALES